MDSQTQTQVLTNKRGGSKMAPLHWGMLLASTVLLTLAAVLMVMEYNILGLIVMLAGIAVRVIDTRM